MVSESRRARGWTQRYLAQRVGFSQRAVSAWERGISEPDEDVKQRVAAALGLQSRPLNASLLDRKPGVQYPGRARLAELPLDVLDPMEFEDFAAALVAALYPQVQRAYRLGKSGHKQGGFDVVATQNGKIRVGVQCKRVARFGPAEVHKTLAAAVTPADECFVYLSRVASPAAHDAMRQYAGWQLWDRQVLSQVVHDLPPGAAVQIVDRFFPNLREQFLGHRLPSPWFAPADHFQRTSRSEHYSHRWRLVGREQLLGDVAAFAERGDGQVGLLVGRGGIGKTKLLYAVSDRLADDKSLSVMFLQRDPDLDARAFELLPAGRLLVVVDDAHDDEAPVAKVIEGVHAANPDANVLLALRPYGEPRVRLELRAAGLHPGDVWRREIDDLDIEDAEALAREVLGSRASRYAPRLAHAARDCPLLLVASAVLIRQGRLSPERLEGDAGLSGELTEVLAGAVIDDMAQHSETRVEVLHAVAALQPFRAGDPDFRNALAHLTDRPFDQAAPHLAALEETGLLLRRGTSFRVVPDLLGDWLLARKAQGLADGISTGYLDRVHHGAQGEALANLIVNAGRVEWLTGSTVSGLLDGLWKAVRGEFESGDADVRLRILDVLARVAFFQPRRCLVLMRWALDHPAEHARTAEMGLASRYSNEALRDAVCQVLRAAAYNPDYLPEAADLLWEVGGDDTRSLSDHPLHALRILSEMAAFQPAGPTVYQELLITAAENWLSSSRERARDPLEVLHPILATEGRQELWNPRAVSWRPFVLNPDAEPVIALRARVLDLAFTQLASQNQSQVFSAIAAIGAALTTPIGGFGLKITLEMQQLWFPEFVRVLHRLEEALRLKPITDPVACLALRSQLQWLAEYGPDHVRTACRTVLSAIPVGLPNDLARAAHGGPIDPPDDPVQASDFQYRQTALTELFTAAVSGLDRLSERQATLEIERCLRDLKSLLDDDTSRARPFLFHLVTQRPVLGEAIAEHAMAAPDSMLTEQLTAVLIALAGAEGHKAISVAWRLLTASDVRIARHVAHAFGLQRGRVGQLLPGEGELLKTLVTHEDDIVHAVALGALRTLGPQQLGLVVELLACAPPERTGFAWWEVAAAVGPVGGLVRTVSWADLPDEYKSRFFGALRGATSIESYETAELIAMLSRDEPDRVIRLLTGRVELAESGAPERYSPLPHHWEGRLRFRDLDAFPDILRDLCGWLAAAPKSMWRQYYGSELFTLVAGVFDVPVRQVIDSYLLEPDESKMRALATILNGAPRSLVWDLDFVRRCLRAADQCGAETLERVQGALYHAVFAGERKGMPGQTPAQGTGEQLTLHRLADRCARGSVEERFYRALAGSAEIWASRDTADWEMQVDGRHW